jgi:hypothetical protein
MYAVSKVRRRVPRIYATHKMFNIVLSRSLIPNLNLIGAKQNVESTDRNLFSPEVQRDFRYPEFVETSGTYLVKKNVQKILPKFHLGLLRHCGYKPADRGFHSRWCQWNFSLT